LEIERIAAALLVERSRGCGIHPVAEELARLVRRQRTELDARQRPVAMSVLQGGPEALGCLPGAQREREQDSRSGRPA
jgi:hypothetical protein